MRSPNHESNNNDDQQNNTDEGIFEQGRRPQICEAILALAGTSEQVAERDSASCELLVPAWMESSTRCHVFSAVEGACWRLRGHDSIVSETLTRRWRCLRALLLDRLSVSIGEMIAILDASQRLYYNLHHVADVRYRRQGSGMRVFVKRELLFAVLVDWHRHTMPATLHQARASVHSLLEQQPLLSIVFWPEEFTARQGARQTRRPPSSHWRSRQTGNHPVMDQKHANRSLHTSLYGTTPSQVTSATCGFFFPSANSTATFCPSQTLHSPCLNRYKISLGPRIHLFHPPPAPTLALKSNSRHYHYHNDGSDSRVHFRHGGCTGSQNFLRRCAACSPRTRNPQS